jgi:hypothetical protein
MKEIKDRVSELETLLSGLENTLKVCEQAPNDPDRGYPYATGYAISTVKNAIKIVNQLISAQ